MDSSLSAAHISRRTALGMLATAAGATLLAACGSTAAPSASPAASSGPASAAPASSAGVASAKPVAGSAVASAAPASASVAAGTAAAKPSLQPKSGGTLRASLIADVSTLDGHAITTGANESVWLV